MLLIPLDLLCISDLRSPLPLPWPTIQSVSLARTVGFVDPVTVRPIPKTTPQRYEILTGLKHWLLAQRAELATVSAQICESLSDDEARQLIAQDSSQETHDPLAEAHHLQALVEQGQCIAAAGRVLGLSRTEASHRRRLLQLAPSVQARVAKGALPIGKARALVGLEERAQLILVQRIERERLTTRQVEALTKAYKQGGRNPRAGAVFDALSPITDPNLVRLENDLTEHLGTRVKISYGKGGLGQLVIDFDNLEILDGVLERLGYTP